MAVNAWLIMYKPSVKIASGVTGCQKSGKLKDQSGKPYICFRPLVFCFPLHYHGLHFLGYIPFNHLNIKQLMVTGWNHRKTAKPSRTRSHPATPPVADYTTAIITLSTKYKPHQPRLSVNHNAMANTGFVINWYTATYQKPLNASFNFIKHNIGHKKQQKSQKKPIVVVIWCLKLASCAEVWADGITTMRTRNTPYRWSWKQKAESIKLWSFSFMLSP